MFNLWFAQSQLKDDIEKLDHQFDAEQPIYYTSLIFHKENDLGKDTITAAFDEIVCILSDPK